MWGILLSSSESSKGGGVVIYWFGKKLSEKEKVEGDVID